MVRAALDAKDAELAELKLAEHALRTNLQASLAQERNASLQAHLAQVRSTHTEATSGNAASTEAINACASCQGLRQNAAEERAKFKKLTQAFAARMQEFELELVDMIGSEATTQELACEARRVVSEAKAAAQGVSTTEVSTTDLLALEASQMYSPGSQHLSAASTVLVPPPRTPRTRDCASSQAPQTSQLANPLDAMEVQAEMQWEVPTSARAITLTRGQRGKLGLYFWRADGTEAGPFTVLSLSRGGSAAESGLIAKGELLHAIDDQCIYHLDTEQVTRLIKGSSGSSVTLTVSQHSATQLHTTELEVAHVRDTTLPCSESCETSASEEANQRMQQAQDADAQQEQDYEQVEEQRRAQQQEELQEELRRAEQRLAQQALLAALHQQQRLAQGGAALGSASTASATLMHARPASAEQEVKVQALRPMPPFPLLSHAVQLIPRELAEDVTSPPHDADVEGNSDACARTQMPGKASDEDVCVVDHLDLEAHEEQEPKVSALCSVDPLVPECVCLGGGRERSVWVRVGREMRMSHRVDVEWLFIRTTSVTLARCIVQVRVCVRGISVSQQSKVGLYICKANRAAAGHASADQTSLSRSVTG